MSDPSDDVAIVLDAINRARKMTEQQSEMLERLGAATARIGENVAVLETIVWAHREILATVLQRLRDDAGEIAWENARSALEARAKVVERTTWPGMDYAPAMIAAEIRLIANADLPMMASGTPTGGAA